MIPELIQELHFFHKNEVEALNSRIDSLSDYFVSANVGYNDGEIHDFSSKTVRSNTLLYLPDNSKDATFREIIDFIHSRMNEVLLKYRDNLLKVSKVFDTYPVPYTSYTTSHREEIHISEYVKDQEFIYHVDQSPIETANESKRKISILIYLNDDFEGGYTEFLHKKYKPKPGYGLIFPSNWCFPHTGSKVLSGKKRIIVTWYYVNLSL